MGFREPDAAPKLRLVPLGGRLPARGSRRPEALDLTAGLRAVAAEACARIPELAHARLDEVQVAVFRSRAARRALTYARCYPLPWEMTRRGRRWYSLTPVYTPAGRRARYLLAFAWPRFWEMTPRARLETVVHELYHLSPAFDGTARTFATGGWHGRGRAWFDGVVRELTDAHLPEGFELEHRVLTLRPEDGGRMTYERLRKPRWVEALRSL